LDVIKATSRLTLVREIIAVYSFKHTYALCGHNEEPFSFKLSGAYSYHTNIYIALNDVKE